MRSRQRGRARRQEQADGLRSRYLHAAYSLLCSSVQRWRVRRRKANRASRFTRRPDESGDGDARNSAGARQTQSALGSRSLVSRRAGPRSARNGGMARDDAGDYSSARPHSSRPRGAPDSARGSGSARRASSPWSRDSPSPPRARSSRAYDEDRRRYGDSRYDSPPPRDAYYDRYSDRDRRKYTGIGSLLGLCPVCTAPALTRASAVAPAYTAGLPSCAQFTCIAAFAQT